MSEEKYVLTLDRYEHGIIVTALNDKRNELLRKECATDAVDDLLIKTIYTPPKKGRWRNEER